MLSQSCLKARPPSSVSPISTPEIDATGSDMNGESSAMRSALVVFQASRMSIDHVRAARKPLTESSSSKTFTIGSEGGVRSGGEPYATQNQSQSTTLRPKWRAPAWKCHIPGTSSPVRPLLRAPSRRGSWSSPEGRARLLRARAGRRTASSRSSPRSAAARSGAARAAARRRRHSAACSRPGRTRGRRAGRASEPRVREASAGCGRARKVFGMGCRSLGQRRNRGATFR